MKTYKITYKKYSEGYTVFVNKETIMECLSEDEFASLTRKELIEAFENFDAPYLELDREPYVGEKDFEEQVFDDKWFDMLWAEDDRCFN